MRGPLVHPKDVRPELRKGLPFLLAALRFHIVDEAIILGGLDMSLFQPAMLWPVRGVGALATRVASVRLAAQALAVPSLDPEVYRTLGELDLALLAKATCGFLAFYMVATTLFAFACGLEALLTVPRDTSSRWRVRRLPPGPAWAGRYDGLVVPKEHGPC